VHARADPAILLRLVFDTAALQRPHTSKLQAFLSVPDVQPSVRRMKLAIVQMLVEPGRKEANLARAEQRIANAAASGAQVILLPEAMPLGWTHPSARTEADAIPDGESCLRLRQAARSHGVFICSGVIERAANLIFNAAVLIDPAGDVILHHRKIHELDIAHDLYTRGERLSVVDTCFGRIGMMICADGFAPGQCISRTLGVMGARTILSPCAWAVPAGHDNTREPYGRLWLDNYSPVARDFEMVIAGASNVGPITAGPWQGRKCIGNSLVIGCRGQELARAPHGETAETILLVDI
jgi:predicted amidohydrolase